ncbi:MAG: hypothetical protein QXL18_01260 [Candidatus Woesearchaeota archaeon]
MGLRDEIKRELEKNHSIVEIKNSLIRRGYLEEDVDEILNESIKNKGVERSKNDKIFAIKEFLDRIAYGFSSQQFINILFMFAGASLFLIGFINALKNAVVTLLSGAIREYSKIKYVSKRTISSSGIIYGFSFFGISIGLVIKNPYVFAFSLLLGSLGIIAHGDLFLEYSKLLLKHEKRSLFLKFISYFGIIITAVSLFLAAFFMDLVPVNGMLINLSFLGFPDVVFKIFGYLIVFEITAILFIISGYILSMINETELVMTGNFHFVSFLKSYVKSTTESYKVFSKNKKVYLLTIATILTTVLQIVGNSYYGIFIYERFKTQFLGGFLNVAVVFVFALLASFLGTIFTKSFSKSLGEAPMLVFGTLLIALMPLTLYFNPKLYSISLAAALSVIGGVIVGIAQSLLAERLLDESELKVFFSSLGFVSIIPILAIGFLGSLIAQLLGLQQLFLYIGIALSLVVMPIYFVIVLIVDAEYRAEKLNKRS